MRDVLHWELNVSDIKYNNAYIGQYIGLLFFYSDSKEMVKRFPVIKLL